MKTASLLLITIAIIIPIYSGTAHGCGLEPGINGGINISYPGSIDIAVAVAKARHDGILPAATDITQSNEVHLQDLLADLGRLQDRLNEAQNEIADNNTASFSLVLVGPGLWSHFYMTAGGVLANYHTNGPIEDKVVVLTHASVLRAMLSGSLSIERATELGLIAYSGILIAPVQRTFETGLQAKT